MELAGYLKMFPPTCLEDLHEAFLFGAADNGRCLADIDHLRAKGLTPRQMVLCLVITRGAA